MSPTIYDTDEELGKLYDQAKGTISMGGINVTYDLTDGLSKKQWVERFKRKIGIEEKLILRKDGRIMVPSMGIY